MSYIYKNGRKFGGNVRIGEDEYEELYLDIPDYQTTGTDDKAIYDAANSLGWTGVITNAVLNIKKTLKEIINFLNPLLINTLTYNQCTAGLYTRCYRCGKVVIFSFNINVTTATASYDYVTGLPPAIEGGWATSSGMSMNGAALTRWWITTDGTLRADGTPTVGWHNGNIAYICQ